MNKNKILQLFVDDLREAYFIENEIVRALPKMEKAAKSTELKEAFSSHLKETKMHVKRLERIFALLGLKSEEIVSSALKGLIHEGGEIIKDYKKSELRDAALIARAQCVEHFEISVYGTLRTYANELGFEDIAEILQQTLDEESNADRKLTIICEEALLAG